MFSFFTSHFHHCNQWPTGPPGDREIFRWVPYRDRGTLKCIYKKLRYFSCDMAKGSSYLSILSRPTVFLMPLDWLHLHRATSARRCCNTSLWRTSTNICATSSETAPARALASSSSVEASLVQTVHFDVRYSKRHRPTVPCIGA